MDPLTLAIVKTIATTCLKFYLSSLLGGGGLAYDKKELGYKVPKWYMNPGHVASEFYAYGTSIEGDEFESVDDARQKAVAQMVTHIRLGNQRMVQEEIRFDRDNVKQRRLVDLFIRDAGLEDFVLMNASVDKKQLVQVDRPEEDMRAFVRLALKTNTYMEYQEDALQELKSKIMHQKTEDILGEMDAEVEAYGESPMTEGVPPDSIDAAAATAPQPEIKVTPPRTPPAAPGAFGNMEDELDAEVAH